MLRASARIFAQRGFHGASTEELGAACGVSGPALYKHFASKQALLGHLLIDISGQLLSGGTAVAAVARTPRQALERLVEFHCAFAISEPDLIRVQDRDLWSLAPADSRQVRRLQREYLELWTALLQRVERDLSADEAAVRAHAVFGLLNSTPHLRSPRSARAQLIRMARRALGLAGT